MSTVPKPTSAPCGPDVATGHMARALREGSNLSLQDVAEAVGIPASDYHAFELGHYRLPPPTLLELASFHGINVEGLLLPVVQLPPLPDAAAPLEAQLLSLFTQLDLDARCRCIEFLEQLVASLTRSE